MGGKKGRCEGGGRKGERPAQARALQMEQNQTGADEPWTSYAALRRAVLFGSKSTKSSATTTKPQESGETSYCHKKTRKKSSLLQDIYRTGYVYLQKRMAQRRAAALFWNGTLSQARQSLLQSTSASIFLGSHLLPAVALPGALRVCSGTWLWYCRPRFKPQLLGKV